MARHYPLLVSGFTIGICCVLTLTACVQDGRKSAVSYLDNLQRQAVRDERAMAACHDLFGPSSDKYLVAAKDSTVAQVRILYEGTGMSVTSLDSYVPFRGKPKSTYTAICIFTGSTGKPLDSTNYSAAYSFGFQSGSDWIAAW